MKKILFVAMPDSIHTARWISQIVGQGWDIHLFPSIDCGVIHPELHDVTVHHAIHPLRWQHQSVRVSALGNLSAAVKTRMRSLLPKLFPDHRAARLARLISRLKPDLVHSLEIQHAGYLALQAKEILIGNFPPWIVTNWGSDIYLFGRLAQHEPKIRSVLSSCAFYSCECRRDVCLAKAYGFAGTLLPVFPNTGGFDLTRTAFLRQPGATSQRRLIMLKGYQNWSGRALVGLRALERCADLLAGYEVAIYCATPDVVIAAELFSSATGVPVSIIPFGSPHDQMLQSHGRARISIGLSISDAISTSLLEAMVMGSFPIQSWTACADEWIEDGKTGILVHPEDPELVESAIRRALADDRLMDGAAQANLNLAAERLEISALQARAVELYRGIFDTIGAGSGLVADPAGVIPAGRQSP